MNRDFEIVKKSKQPGKDAGYLEARASLVFAVKWPTFYGGA